MIYCVEDDASIRELMVYTLGRAGFSAEGFENGTDFIRALNCRIPELVMLDVVLPDDDGFRILEKMKAHPDTRDIPVIMITARSSEIDKVRGLNMGADDYMVKPIGMLEMVARVRCVLRRTGKRSENMYIRVGSIKINTNARTVMVGKNRIPLTCKEYDILKLLAGRPGMVFSREQILANVWETDYFGGSRTVDVHVGALRGKLGECSSYIETVRSIGYRLEVPVKKRNVKINTAKT